MWRVMGLMKQEKMVMKITVSAIGVLLVLTISRACSQDLMKPAFSWLFVNTDLF